MITQERLKELLHYDPDTGMFTWRVKTARQIKVGAVAGCSTVYGYWCVRVDHKLYLAHRLAFLYMTGEWPEHDVDHINTNRTDNRWVNLRAVTNAANQQNKRAAQANNRTGLLGVAPFRHKFRAAIKLDGKQTHLGCFNTPEEAHAAYLAAKAKLHPFSTL